MLRLGSSSAACGCGAVRARGAATETRRSVRLSPRAAGAAPGTRRGAPGTAAEDGGGPGPAGGFAAPTPSGGPAPAPRTAVPSAAPATARPARLLGGRAAPGGAAAAAARGCAGSPWPGRGVGGRTRPPRSSYGPERPRPASAPPREDPLLPWVSAPVPAPAGRCGTARGAATRARSGAPPPALTSRRIRAAAADRGKRATPGTAPAGRTRRGPRRTPAQSWMPRALSRSQRAGRALPALPVLSTDTFSSLRSSYPASGASTLRSTRWSR